ncbi:protein of unknown function [Burkholderia multivorans]
MASILRHCDATRRDCNPTGSSRKIAFLMREMAKFRRESLMVRLCRFEQIVRSSHSACRFFALKAEVKPGDRIRNQCMLCQVQANYLTAIRGSRRGRSRLATRPLA